MRTYYTQFKYLRNELGVDENRYVLQFIRDLTDPIIREAMRARPIAIAEDKMRSVADHAMPMEETETGEKTNVSSAQRVKHRNTRASINSTSVNFGTKYWVKQIDMAKTAASEASIKNCPMCHILILKGNTFNFQLKMPLKLEMFVYCSMKHCLPHFRKERKKSIHWRI